VRSHRTALSNRKGVSRIVKSGKLSSLILVLFSLDTPVLADTPLELGVRANILLGNGRPANDILGAGLVGKYYLSDGWFIAVTLDTYNYDFEWPYRVLHIEQDPAVKTIDSKIRTTTLGAAIGRRKGDRSGLGWFWSAGIGVGFPEVGDAAGPTDGGGTFDLDIDARTEIQLISTLGTTYYLSNRWSLTAAVRAEHHFLDITVTDRVTGETANVDSQSPLGAYVSINVAF